MQKLLNDPNVLHVASYEEFEPIIYSTGKGFEADILRAIARLWNVDVIFHPQKQFENIWELPEKYNYDVAAGGITPQKDRKVNAIFSKPTVFYAQSLLVRKKDYLDGKITGYESFNKKYYSIGVVKEVVDPKNETVV